MCSSGVPSWFPGGRKRKVVGKRTLSTSSDGSHLLGYRVRRPLAIARISRWVVKDAITSLVGPQFSLRVNPPLSIPPALIQLLRRFNIAGSEPCALYELSDRHGRFRQNSFGVSVEHPVCSFVRSQANPIKCLVSG